MEPLVGVWLTSLVGAGAFSTAGYLFGQRKVARSSMQVFERPTMPNATTRQEALSPSLESATAVRIAPAFDEPSPDEETTRVGTLSDQLARASAQAVPSERHHIIKEQLAATKAELETAIADATSAAEKAKATENALKKELEAARAAASSAAEKLHAAEAASVKLKAATAESSSSTEKLRAAEAANAELARQLEAVRGQLRDEVIARASASAHAEELGDRLAKASEETASLRHKVALLSGVGRGKGLGASQPPNARVSAAPPATSGPTRSAPPARPSNDEANALQAEVARLALENRELRQRVLGSVPPKKATSRGSVPDLDLDVYQRLVERIGKSSRLTSAALTDEVGSLIFGSGELAEGLAAFGAYIRDASTRTERLLPLEGVDEIDIRDRRGSHLSTRVIVRTPVELSVVLLSSPGESLAAAKKLVDETIKGGKL
jgi:hypothetical protein